MRLSNPYTLVLPPAILGSAAIAFFHTPTSYRQLPSTFPSRIFYTGFFLLFAATIFIYHLAGLTRTAGVHWATIGLFVLIILLLSSDAPPRAVLGLAVATGVLQRVMAYYAGSVQMGMDSVSHARIARLVSESGSIEPLSMSKYWYAPFYHILTSVGDQVLGVSIRLSTLLVVGILLAIVPALLIYSIVNKYWDEKFGVIGALFFLTGDYSIGWSVMTTPTSLGIIFFSIALFAVHQYIRTPSKWYFIVLLASLAALMETHQVSFFITVIGLSVYFLVGQLVQPQDRLTIITLPSLFGALLIIDWMTTVYGGPDGDSPSFIGSLALQFLGRLERAGYRTAVRPTLENATYSGADALTPFHTVGLALLIGFGVLGGLTWLRHEDRGGIETALPMGTVVAVLFGVAFAGPLVNIDLLIPRRWFAFIYIPVAIFAAAGITVITSAPPVSLDSKIAGILLVFCLIPVIIFMSFNFMGSLDDPVVDAPESQRFAMTDSENTGYQTAIDYQGDNVLVADFLAWTILERYYGTEAVMYAYYRNGSIANGGDIMYVHRDYSQTNSNSYRILFEDTTSRVYGPLPSVPRGSTVYDNGNMTFIVP
ncbi:hypothetical protein DJ84_22020 [Halorubrum ezzemoulense]|nr:hypothetical protein DJ84_22020 [Halorubrum ezzemoulense]